MSTGSPILQPIVLWIIGIAVLAFLLVRLGGFHRPHAVVVIVVLAIALVCGFVFYRLTRR